MRSSPHAGSKPGFTHLTDVAQDAPARIARAQAWSAETGRPVPPHLRWRRPLQPAVPLGIRDRHNRYARANRTEDLTPAQLRRARHKHGRREIAAYPLIGYDPAAREQDRVLAARRRKRLRHAQHILAQTVPAGPLQKTRGGLGRRAKRVVESAPSEYVAPWSKPGARPHEDIAAIGRMPSGLS